MILHVDLDYSQAYLTEHNQRRLSIQFLDPLGPIGLGQIPTLVHLQVDRLRRVQPQKLGRLEAQHLVGLVHDEIQQPVDLVRSVVDELRDASGRERAAQVLHPRREGEQVVRREYEHEEKSECDEGV